MARGRLKGLLISSCGRAIGGAGARRSGRRARSEFWAIKRCCPCSLLERRYAITHGAAENIPCQSGRQLKNNVGLSGKRKRVPLGGSAIR